MLSSSLKKTNKHVFDALSSAVVLSGADQSRNSLLSKVFNHQSGFMFLIYLMYLHSSFKAL